ncbi:MAG TPA: hypothetical protein VNK41_02805 [Vicinamibacterales bacterium]|nr:hypothetical protein [Vicinamibacterales bacterium]
MNRRQFLATAVTAAAGAFRSRAQGSGARLVTVTGVLGAADAGLVLPHEHILVSLDVPGPYDPAARDLPAEYRYDADAVLRAALPHVKAAMAAGVRTMAEATPAFLGRDPRVLKRLSEATGLAILTNTGYYGAREDRHLPAHALTESADALAARWTREVRDGIDGTGIRPGFIKIGVDPGPLSEMDVRLVQAAARTHRATGLAIACHTGPAIAARGVLAVLQDEGVDPRAWIWVHAQGESDMSAHVEIAQRGAWVEFDGVGPETIDQHVALIANMRRHGVINRVLVSHDAGWYSIGQPGGGEFRGFTDLTNRLLPALRKSGLSEAEIRQITRTNPAAALAIK